MRRNIIAALAGNGSYVAAQWLIMVTIVRAVGAEGAGLYALALAVTAPIALLLGFQLRVLQATDARNEFAFDDFMDVRLLTSAAFVAVLGVVAAVAGYGQDALVVILLVGLAKMTEGFADVFHGHIQKHERMDRIMVSQMLRGGGGLLAIASGLALTGSLTTALLLQATIWLAVILVFDRPAAHASGQLPRRTTAARWSRVRALLLLGAPLGLASAAISYHVNIPRYLLESSWGAVTLGYFSPVAYLSLLVTAFTDAAGQAAAPRLARAYVAHRREFYRLLASLSAFGLLTGGIGLVVAVLHGNTLLRLLYGTDYGAHQPVFVLIMLFAILLAQCSIIGVGLTAGRLVRVQIAILAVVIVADLVLGPRWIARAGEIGAAWTMIAGTSIWALLSGSALALGGRGRSGGTPTAPSTFVRSALGT